MDIISNIVNFCINVSSSFIPSLSEQNRLEKKKLRLIKQQKNISLKLEIKALEKSIRDDEDKLKGNIIDKN